MSRSSELFARAQEYIPGGVYSPVHAFKAVGGTPLFFKRGQGAYIFDEDNNQYVDYVGSWGPLILGHAHPAVIQAVQETLVNGLSFGAPTALGVELAEKVHQIMPTVEMIRMVNSGTEATLSAIRLARGYTQRDKILKFEGCYHGHSDSLLVKAGSGALTLGIPSSPGVPAALAQYTLTASFNDLDQVETLFSQYGQDIAAIIVEPIAGNMNCIPPAPGFLQGLRDICDQYGSLLIFDEVMTGFRVALGGAQARYNVTPDITTLGKIIGGGMPVGAFGGRKAIMEKIAPLGTIYQAGTLSGNPLAMAAGLATLNEITADPNFHNKLEETTNNLIQGLIERAQAAHIPFIGIAIGGMFGIFFTQEKTVDNFTKATQCDIALFNKFFHGMLKEGVYLAPSAFEAGFTSSAHGNTEIEKTLAVAEGVFQQLRTS